MGYLLMLLLGLFIGSFLNLCIYRIPRGESVIFPSSYCESCGQKLKPWHLIPVLSWLILKGRCQDCKTPLDFKHPLVESLTGVLFMMLFKVYGLIPQLFVSLVLTSILIVLAFIDWNHFILPNKVILTGFLLGLFFQFFSPCISWIEAIMGFLLGGGFLYLLALVSDGAMGGGDIKMAALLGFYSGGQRVLIILYLGALLATLVWLFLILIGIKEKKDPIPLGTFMSVGALITMLYGNELLTWYEALWVWLKL